MKKVFIFASCFALVLVLSKVSVAQEVAVVPCNCHATVAPFVMPMMHPHMHYSISARDIRRTARFEGRMNVQQMQVQQRLGAAPAFAGAPGAVGEMPAFSPGMYTPGGTVPSGFWAGPAVQTGRMNNSKQRVGVNNVPVINFMSVVRGGQRSF